MSRLEGLRQFSLLQALPKSKRNVTARSGAKNPEVIAVSKQFGQAYFDGARDYGYGGYRYDGRWIPVARDMVDFFDLKPGDKFLDIGCAKGFLVKDLRAVCPGLDAFGLDVSRYAIEQAEPEAKPYVFVGDARTLPFRDDAFKAAVCINTLHNFVRAEVVLGLKEIQRVCGGRAFIQVDSYTTPEQKAVFESWVLTAEFHDYPERWRALFQEAGYTGAYDWTII